MPKGSVRSFAMLPKTHSELQSSVKTPLQCAESYFYLFDNREALHYLLKRRQRAHRPHINSTDKSIIVSSPSSTINNTISITFSICSIPATSFRGSHLSCSNSIFLVIVYVRCDKDYGARMPEPIFEEQARENRSPN